MRLSQQDAATTPALQGRGQLFSVLRFPPALGWGMTPWMQPYAAEDAGSKGTSTPFLRRGFVTPLALSEP